MVYTRILSHKNISVHKQEKYKNHSYTANALENNFSCLLQIHPNVLLVKGKAFA